MAKQPSTTTVQRVITSPEKSSVEVLPSIETSIGTVDPHHLFQQRSRMHYSDSNLCTMNSSFVQPTTVSQFAPIYSPLDPYRPY